MNFGIDMVMNIEYDNAKKLLEKYVKEHDELYQFLEVLCKKFDEAIFDTPEFEGFNYKKAKKYMRAWDVLKEIPTEKKNLFLLFCATDFNYEKTLVFFNGTGNTCKNIATLRVMISKIRKIIRDKYQEIYGDTEFVFNSIDSSLYS